MKNKKFIKKVLDGIKTDYSDRSAFRQSLIALLKLKLPICILLAVVTVASGCWFYIDSNRTAYTEMSLNYEESAYGLNPNSTRFNVYDIESPEVVKNMLTYCGINPDDVDINDVISCISVSPTNTRAFSEDSLFISTTYKITMKKPDSIKDVDVNTLLTFLCKAYKDNLYSNYTENRSILGFDIERFKDDEFMVIADLLDLKAQQIEKYLNTRAKQSKSFTDEESDETFKSLSQKVEDIRNYDIKKYRSFVEETGCTHDRISYINSLSYYNRMKNIDFSKNMAAYSVYNKGIEMYDKAMVNVIMIPSVDKNKNAYYMSRTKTGMDYMAKQANDYLLSAQETEKEISVNKDLIKKIKKSKNRVADIKTATNMISDIRGKFSDLSKQIELVDKAYIKYKTKDYLTFKDYNASLAQRLHLEIIFVIDVAILLAIFAAIWLKLSLRIGGEKKQ